MRHSSYPDDRGNRRSYDRRDDRQHPSDRYGGGRGGPGGPSHSYRRHDAPHGGYDDRGQRGGPPGGYTDRVRLQHDREQSEMDRDSRTVYVSQIHPKIDERDVFEFFSNCGRLMDIRLIRDSNTLKSKGLAYVEFVNQEGASTALALSGQLLGGFAISVQVTQSEKNRAAAAEQRAQTQDLPLKLFVGGLHPNLAEADIEGVFKSFGTIDNVEIARDHSGNPKGHAFVLFRKTSEAQIAISQMNGRELLGQTLRLSVVETRDAFGGALDSSAYSHVDSGGMHAAPVERLEDESGNSGLAMTAQTRVSLMKRLQRDGDRIATPSNAPGSHHPGGAQAGGPAAPPTSYTGPSSCVLLSNMFDPRAETGAEWDIDLEEDVRDECGKFGTVVHIKVDKREPSGQIFVKFRDPSAASACIQRLNGRYFGKKMVQALAMDPHAYSAKFPGH